MKSKNGRRERKLTTRRRVQRRREGSVGACVGQRRMVGVRDVPGGWLCAVC
jgi:hypothetical protein